MSFDDIPEDYEQSFMCPNCRGSVQKNIISGAWECLDCDFKKEEEQ